MELSYVFVYVCEANTVTWPSFEWISLCWMDSSDSELGLNHWGYVKMASWKSCLHFCPLIPHHVSSCWILFLVGSLVFFLRLCSWSFLPLTWGYNFSKLENITAKTNSRVQTFSCWIATLPILQTPGTGTWDPLANLPICRLWGCSLIQPQ